MTPPVMTMRCRDLVGELMDDPALAEREHRRALAGLARLNALSGAAGPVWRALRRRLGPPGPFTLLDVACGSGDVLLSVAARARRAGYTPALHAADISAVALARVGERAARCGLAVTTHEVDAVAAAVPGTFDAVTCSLFCHHLDDASVTRLLGGLAASAGRALVVSDLVRSRRGLALAWFASRAFTASRVVRVDAVRSVRAAFTIPELRRAARAAGLDSAELEAAWPQRVILTWSPGGAAP